MSWGRLDDGFHDHPKVEDLSLASIGLWTLCLSRALRHHRTDPVKGYVPEARVRKLAGRQMKQLVTELVTPPPGRKYGLWEPIEGGWLIHDFEQYLRPGRDPEEAAEAGRRGAAARWGSDGKQPSDSHADSHSSGSSSGVATDGTRAHPVPSRPKEPSSMALSARREAFDEFWAIYPRHAGKRAAEAAFERAMTRAERQAIIVGAVRLRDDPNRDPQFTPYPATWLNRDGWNDEPLPPRNGRRQPAAAKSFDEWA